MKTREGTTVEADDLMEEVIATALEKTRELGKIEGLPEEEVNALVERIGLAALKYFILRVDPVKRMVFDPNESVNLHGDTGPFIQYSYARISSLERHAPDSMQSDFSTYPLHPLEKSLIQHIYSWPACLSQAVEEYNPSVVAAWVLDLAKHYNRFYGEHPVLKAESDVARDFRLLLSRVTARLIRNAMELLGIQVPDRM